MIGDDECDKEEDDELHLTDREASLNWQLKGDRWRSQSKAAN